jgi:hypothetical protein
MLGNKIWNGKWEDSPMQENGTPKKPDWLAQQFQNIGGTGYKNVPGSETAKFKWVNPKES